MKLLTHNMLSCHIKGVTNGFPFKLEVAKLEECEQDFDPDFLRHIYPRIVWSALKSAADTIGTVLMTSCSPGSTCAYLIQNNIWSSAAIVSRLPCTGLDGLPEEVTEEMLHDEEFLKAFHHALLEVCIALSNASGDLDWSGGKMAALMQSHLDRW